MEIQATKYLIIEKIMQINDESLLSEVQAILELSEEIKLTDWQEGELDKRATRHAKGESKNYTWNEVKERAKAAS